MDNVAWLCLYAHAFLLSFFDTSFAMNSLLIFLQFKFKTFFKQMLHGAFCFILVFTGQLQIIVPVAAGADGFEPYITVGFGWKQYRQSAGYCPVIFQFGAAYTQIVVPFIFYHSQIFFRSYACI